MKKRNSSPRLSLSLALFKGSFVHNPVLTQIIGICPIVGAATTLRDGFALGVGITVILTLTEGLTSLFLKKIPRWVRMCVYTLFSLALVLICDRFLFSVAGKDGSGLGIYLYLLSVNALTVIRCEKFACKTGVLNSMTDGFAAGIGYGAVSVIIGAARELLNYGTVFSSADALPRLSQTALPFIPLVLLGFLAALHKWMLIKFYPDEIRDTFSMKASGEKPVLKDPGIFPSDNKNASKVIKEYKEIRPRHISDESEKGGEE